MWILIFICSDVLNSTTNWYIFFHKILCLYKKVDIDNRVIISIPSYTLDNSAYPAVHYTVGNTAVVICGDPEHNMYHSVGIPATGLCEQTRMCSNIQRGVCKQSKVESQLLQENYCYVKPAEFQRTTIIKTYSYNQKDGSVGKGFIHIQNDMKYCLVPCLQWHS